MNNVENKQIELIEEYFRLTFESHSSYVPIPKIMESLSKKWNCSRKLVREYISDFPLVTNNKFQILLSPPRKGMPKTHIIKKGMVNFYFISFYVLDKENPDGIRGLRGSDLNSGD